MGIVEDVVTLLDGTSTALLAGTSLFAHMMPELGPTALPTMAVQLEPGMEAVRTYGATLPVAVRSVLVLITRTTAPTDSDYVDPRRAQSMGYDAWSTLEQTVNTVIPAGSTSGTYLFAALGDTEPVYVGRDERRRAVFEQRLLVDYKPSTGAY